MAYQLVALPERSKGPLPVRSSPETSVLGGLIVFAVQLALIAGLLVQRRRAEARNAAMLRAIPELVFVLQRDGTYVDYHASDPRILFVPPAAFMGKKVREVMPGALADTLMDAIERAYHGDDPVVVEYGLEMDGTRHFEARLVRAGGDRVLAIVQDVTDAKRAAQINRDLAGRLIAAQEVERQRIARELHDDVGQKLVLLNFDLEHVVDELHCGELRGRVERISSGVEEIASDLRSLSHELHPSKLNILGLVGATESLCDDISRRHGVRIVFTHDALTEGVNPEISLCLYRTAQEALHNVVRHSRATEAHVSLTCKDQHLILQIADPGVGFDPQNPPHAGLGLVSMRERAAFLRGRLVIHATPGGGTRLGVSIPVTLPATPLSSS